ncbi:MAG: hypothetical protein KAR65_03740 [Anaerolineales bacterium]|nr:hypothetical protein [Anaerolineales bacterium]
MSLELDRLGFHYYHDQLHYTQADLDRWLPIFQSINTTWLTLSGPRSHVIPEFFLRELIEADIEPIVHLEASIGELNVRTLRPLLANYTDFGIKHIVLHDRPNMRAQWDPSSWSRGDLVERFLDHLIPLFEFQAEYFLKPIFPPLEPGGDYWDTAFLRTSLGSLQRRGKGELLKNLTLGLYQWSYEKPLDWGTGGPDAWSLAQPYDTPATSQDHRGFRINEWYSAISREVVGTELPMLVLAGGISPQNQTLEDGTDSGIVAYTEILEHVRSDEAPSMILNLALDPHTVAEGLRDRWETSIEQPTPSERIKAKVKKLFTAEETSTTNSNHKKVISHYVLLPMTNQRNTAQDWVDVGPFALAVKPVVGFSVREAQFAERVTIIGSEKDIPATIESQLRRAGCDVNRFRMADASELLVMAAELASNNLTSGVVNV